MPYVATFPLPQAKLDSDPHFWMPLTLSAESYGSIMTGKGVAEADSTAHYARMSAFKTKFLEANPGPGLFGCIDAGSSRSPPRPFTSPGPVLHFPQQSW